MHRRFSIALGGFLLAAAAAHADEPPPSPPRLVQITASMAQGEPQSELSAIPSQVRGELERATPDIQRCLVHLAPPRASFDSAPRRMEIHLRFNRSGQPERVWTGQRAGVPLETRRCLLEAARALEIQPAPDGELLVTLVYELR